MRKIIILFNLVFCICLIHGQIRTTFFQNGNALNQIKHSAEKYKVSKIKQFPPFDVQKFIDEDKQNRGLDIPFRFGKGFDTNITLSDGEWQPLENGRLWLMEFQSKGAYSINFVFDNFYLPDSAELYITNKRGTMLYGPVTYKQNTKNGYFLTDLIVSDDVIIYIFEPEDKKGQTQLNIKRVVHAYRNLFSNMSYGNLGGSESCNNDIACFPDWDKESDAVALVLLSSGTEWCSGSLLMTANNSFSPYFLSAFHCIDSSADGNLSTTEISNAENWMFKFQYKMITCGGSSATSGITYNGAKFRAGWNVSDFLLMEMDNSPIGNTEFSWLGWDRTGTTPTSGSCIHHPAGDVMKISFEENQFQMSTWGAVNNHWLLNFDDGVVQKGSSGSPILDQNKRVVGQLHGNQNYNQYLSFCSQPRAEYGRFDISWTGGGTNTTRLSNWLDPTGIGTLTINTSRYPVLFGPTQACPDENMTFTIINFPEDATVVWHQDTPITRVSPQGADTCTFISSVVCGGAISAYLTYNGITDTLTQAVTVGGGYYNSNDFSIQVYETSTGHHVNVEGPECLCENTTYDIVAVNNGNTQVSNYNWAMPSYWTVNSSNDNTIQINTGSNTEGNIAVSTTNPCGYDETLSETYLYQGICGGYGFLFSLSPNPASDAVTISMNPAATTSTSTLAATSTKAKNETAIYSVKVVDSYSTIAYTGIKKSKQFTIPTASLRNGIYTVIVSDENKSYQRKLIVLH
jgi:hypothetical protein